MDISRQYDVVAKPAVYKGITFRSRTEVCWAVYFDCLGWEWIYEHKRHKIPCGTYLPDFYFPDIKAHGEVKPNEFTSLERLKCVELSMLYPNTQVLLLEGYPSFNSIQIVENGALLTEGVPVGKNDKYYPIFYSSRVDTTWMDQTTKAILASVDYSFDNG